MKKISIIFISGLFLLSGCKDLFEPETQNIRGLEDAYNDPIFAQGILVNAYGSLPTNSWRWSDMATDNAVSRSTTDIFYRLASGEWTANIWTPLSRWQTSYNVIQILNRVLLITDDVNYARNQDASRLFQDRAKGEAYGLRALYYYHLLQAHAGFAGGELLGVPIMNDIQDINTDFNIPRAGFQECVEQIFNDVDSAIKLLPTDYGDISNDSQIPAQYQHLEISATEYNRAFGNGNRQLLSARIALGVKAQTALLAASPAYSEGSGLNYEQAANIIGELLDLNNGLSGFDNNGLLWYEGAIVDNLGSGLNPPEILWRGSTESTSTSMESNHFPPSLFGQGLLNPTQNLVDAFPMANGYPIDHPLSDYNANNPYTNRDPRLRHFIIYNGNTAGVSNTYINTSLDPYHNTPQGDNDGINKIETSTRTGYYLKKLLRQDVNLNPNSVNGQRHLKPRMRYTEFYLGFAEAANEVWGPTGTGSFSYSAYDIVKAIRQRAGIGLNNADPYLEEARNNKDVMRALIQNERRLELCFEDYRFWDLRRWNLDLTETGTGVQILNNQYQIINVQNRNFREYMKYGPIPHSETLKFPALQQNTGWEF